MTNAIGPDTETTDRKRENLLALLNDVQRKNGYLSKEELEAVSQSVGLPLSEVYSVSSFYSFLTKKPMGKHVIRVCQSLPCYMKNSQMIVETISAHLGVSPGQTSADGLFSVELVNCIGACDEAPAMPVDNKLHGHLTPEEIVRVLDSYK